GGDFKGFLGRRGQANEAVALLRVERRGGLQADEYGYGDERRQTETEQPGTPGAERGRAPAPQQRFDAGAQIGAGDARHAGYWRGAIPLAHVENGFGVVRGRG